MPKKWAGERVEVCRGMQATGTSMLVAAGWFASPSFIMVLGKTGVLNVNPQVLLCLVI